MNPDVKELGLIERIQLHNEIIKCRLLTMCVIQNITILTHEYN